MTSVSHMDDLGKKELNNRQQLIHLQTVAAY